jgi:hypothetical protein
VSMNAGNHSPVNVKESMENLKSMTLDSCCKKLWPEVLDDFHGFTTQQNQTRNMVV